MRRYEAIREIVDLLTDEIVICNLGHPSQELFCIKDRPKNFYMLGSMGLASSIALGIAISNPEKVLAIDGDGSILMNFGAFATVGVSQAKNFAHIIIDNQAHGSTGFQETMTSRGLKLNEVAKSCGIKNVFYINSQADVKPVIKKVLKEDEGPYVVVIRVEKGTADHIGIIPLDGTTIKRRFMEAIHP